MSLEKKSKWIIYIIIGIMLVYIIPIASSFSYDNAISPFKNNTEDFNAVLSRSILISSITTVIIIVVSFLISLLLFSIPFFSRIGNQLSYLMLPILLGSISTAFIYRTSLSNTDFLKNLLDNNKVQLYFFWGFLQFWQYGTLFIYLFWLSFQNIPKPLLAYCKGTKLPFGIVLKDVIIPSTKNQIILFSLICFVFTFYENAKSSLVFFFSRGTNTELIAGWFQRMFQQKTSIISADVAAKSYYSSGLFLTIIACFTLGLILLSTYYVIKFITSKYKNTETVFNFLSFKLNINLSKAIAILLLSFTLIPVAIPYLTVKNIEFENIKSLLLSITYTLISSIFATLLALLFGIFARLGWKRTLNDFNNKSIIFFVLLFSLLIIPPICIYIVSFYWFGLTGYSNFFVLFFLWILIHSILALPLLGGFLLSIHFRVKAKELDYLKAYKIKWQELIKYSFIKRFALEYILTLIFAFSFIWNDFGLNSVMSNRIDSFATILKMSFSGRSANQSLGFLYYSISLLIALTCIWIWKLILQKAQRNIE